MRLWRPFLLGMSLLAGAGALNALDHMPRSLGYALGHSGMSAYVRAESHGAHGDACRAVSSDDVIHQIEESILGRTSNSVRRTCFPDRLPRP